MKIDRRFFSGVVVTLLAAVVLSAYPLWKYGSPQAVLAAVAGCMLSVVNAVAGSLTIAYAIDKPSDTFLKAVLGGMGIRLALMLAAFFVLIKVMQLDTLALSVSLLGFYVVFLVLEIVSMQRMIGMRTNSPKTG
jgi:branched-subunit amino acid ABC-type transport system permease component